MIIKSSQSTDRLILDLTTGSVVIRLQSHKFLRATNPCESLELSQVLELQIFPLDDIQTKHHFEGGCSGAPALR